MRHERSALLLALAQRRGNLSMVADDLGLNLPMLRTELKAHDLDPDNLPSIKEVKRAYTKSYLESLLAGTEGNVTAAARLAGISQPAMSHYIRRYAVDPLQFKSASAREKLDQHRRAARINYSRAKALD